MRTKLIMVFGLGLLMLGLFIMEEKRLDRIIDAQRREQEEISTGYRKALGKIGEDLENGLLTYEEASELMLREHEKVQEKNVEILERSLDRVVPRQ